MNNLGAENAIKSGLTPRRLEFYLRNNAGVDAIAEIHGTSAEMVRELMNRWTLGHLDGHAKSNVRLVKICEEG